jgi:hypothetical protein
MLLKKLFFCCLSFHCHQIFVLYEGTKKEPSMIVVRKLLSGNSLLLFGPQRWRMEGVGILAGGGKLGWRVKGIRSGGIRLMAKGKQ